MQTLTIIEKNTALRHDTKSGGGASSSPFSAISEDRLAAALAKISVCDTMASAAVKMAADGFFTEAQGDRLIDTIKRHKHGVHQW